MRPLTFAIACLLTFVQYPLWLGKGGWLAVQDMREQVDSVRVRTEHLMARNQKLDTEVQNLGNGTAAVEERARHELGMIKHNEIFVQVLSKSAQPAASMTEPPMQAAPPADGAPQRH